MEDDNEGISDELSANLSLSTDEKIKLLTGEYIGLKEEYIEAGVKEHTFNNFLRCHIRTDPSFRPVRRGRSDSARCLGLCQLSWKRLCVYLLVPSLFASLIGVYLHTSQIDLIQILYDSPCLVKNGALVSEIARPLKDCSTCQGLTQVPVVESISEEYFLDQYAFSAIPLLVKGAAKNWSALNTYNFKYFKRLYTNKEDLDMVAEKCQFFSYNTEFNTLEEALNMTDERANLMADEQSWYFGW